MSIWTRTLARALDAVCHGFVAATAQLAVWHDQLEPPPPVDPVVVDRILARVAPAPASRFRPSRAAHEAAVEAHQSDRPVFLVEMPTTRPVYVVHDSAYGTGGRPS